VKAEQMDSNALSFADATFTHSVSNALIFVLPDDGVSAVKELYRTLKPGGLCAVNSWAYVPNMSPIQVAARETRTQGTPLPRQGSEKRSDAEFLKRHCGEGGL
jgi:ubiquinone/menaquinone biosynthesis C-methylase UbiE